MITRSSQPLVSVCIPAYNNERYIGRTIESVLHQSYSRFELIIVDDCSSDSTLEIIERFCDERIEIHRNETNLGPAANWSAVVARARGPYVKLLCGDDVLYPLCLEEQVHAMELGGPKVAIVASKRDIIDENGRTLVGSLGVRGMKGLVPGPVGLRRVVRSGTTPLGEPAAVLMRASMLERTSGFRDHTRSMLDVDMWCQLLLQGDLYVVPETLAAFRVQDASWSHAAAKSKASEVRDLWHDIRSEHPELVPRATVQVGLARSAFRTRAKRILYMLLKWRKAIQGGLSCRMQLGDGGDQGESDPRRLDRVVQAARQSEG